MSRAGALAALLCGAVALAPLAWANAPESSLRPKPRSGWSGTAVLDAIDRVTPAPPAEQAAPTVQDTPPPSAVPVSFNAEIRPKARPWIDRTRPNGPGDPTPVPTPAPTTQPATGTATDPSQPVVTGTTVEADEAPALASSAPVLESPRPKSRPRNIQRIVAAARAAQRAPQRSGSGARTVATGPQGAICGSSAIRGKRLAAIPGRIAGCGVAQPVQVTQVGGVRLSTPATMNCETAQALLSWTERGAKPAVGRLGGGIASYRVVAHYACRTRNNQPGARISEHGKGRAIDIAAIKLNNGVDITVLNGWKDPTQGPILRGMWRAACGPFGTVLGPEANRFHRDHFHFDTAAYRSGSYCR